MRSDTQLAVRTKVPHTNPGVEFDVCFQTHQRGLHKTIVTNKQTNRRLIVYLFVTWTAKPLI